MGSYSDFHRRSIEQPDAFWAEQAKLVDWHKPFGKVLDFSRPPFAKWFDGGETNLCHNAIDRHLADARRAEGAGLHFDRGRPGAQLHLRRAAPGGAARGGDDAVARGEEGRPRDHLHADDPGGRPSRCSPARASARSTRSSSAASPRQPGGRIDDAKPSSIITADGGLRAWARSCRTSLWSTRRSSWPSTRRRKCSSYKRGLDPGCRCVAGRDVDWAGARARAHEARKCPAPGSNRTSLPTSSTPRARPASPRACSATSAAMRWRSPRR